MKIHIKKAIGASFIIPAYLLTTVYVLTASYSAMLPYMNTELWFSWVVLYTFWCIGVPITFFLQRIKIRKKNSRTKKNEN